MAGNRRIIVGNITQGNLKGKALGDALYRDLCNEATEDGSTMGKTINISKNKSYGKKK